MTPLLARNWWTFVLRGVAAILFGVLTFVSPGITLMTLLLFFAAYAMADGVFNVVGAVRGVAQRERWFLQFLQGLLGIGIAVLTVIRPGVTALTLLLWIAVWAIVTGALQIAAAFELRRAIKGEWLLGLAGAASIAFGIIAMFWPGAGALAVLSWIEFCAIAYGVVLISLGFRIRSWGGHDTGAPIDQRTVPI